MPIQSTEKDSNEKEGTTFHVDVPTLSLSLSPTLPQPPEFSNLQLSQVYSESVVTSSLSPPPQQQDIQTSPYEQQQQEPSYDELYNSNIGVYHPEALSSHDQQQVMMREEFIVQHQHPSVQYSSALIHHPHLDTFHHGGGGTVVIPYDSSSSSSNGGHPHFPQQQQVFIQQRPYEIQSVAIPTPFAHSPYEQQPSHEGLTAVVVIEENEEQENPSQVIMEHYCKNGDTEEFHALDPIRSSGISSFSPLLNWIKNNRVFTAFLVCDIVLLISGTVLAIVNSFVHVILCVIATMLPFALVFSQKSASRRHINKWRIVASFLLGAMFADNIAAMIYVWYQILSEDHQHAWEIVIVLAFTFLQYIVALLGCVVIYRTIMNDRRVNVTASEQVNSNRSGGENVV